VLASRRLPDPGVRRLRRWAGPAALARLGPFGRDIAPPSAGVTGRGASVCGILVLSQRSKTLPIASTPLRASPTDPGPDAGSSGPLGGGGRGRRRGVPGLTGPARSVKQAGRREGERSDGGGGSFAVAAARYRYHQVGRSAACCVQEVASCPKRGLFYLRTYGQHLGLVLTPVITDGRLTMRPAAGRKSGCSCPYWGVSCGSSE
jgi:hypothetical protein